MPVSTLRYQLPRKAIKTDCPQCGPKHRRTLSRYIDTHTGEPLPDLFGRCDRESNCTYHISPYHKTASGLSYADQVYQQWKQDNAGRIRPAFSVDQYQRMSSPLSAPAPVCAIPTDLFARSLAHYDRNQFARLLLGQFGQNVAEGLLQRFQIGTSNRWPGACIFWYVDEQNRVRGGQIKLFDDWHTVKYVDHTGRKRAKVDWVHSALKYRLERDEKPLPNWLHHYISNAERSPCLFGLPQLQNAPVDQPVAIVEAPKTAVICTPYFPQFTWLAAGSLSYLNIERLTAVHDRRIVLFPDLSHDGSAFARWSRIADDLRQQGFSVAISDYLEQRATDNQRRQGLDLADFLLSSNKLRPYIVLNGKIIYGEVMEVRDCDFYPEEWDKPNEKNAIPTIRSLTLSEWKH